MKDARLPGQQVVEWCALETLMELGRLFGVATLKGDPGTAGVLHAAAQKLSDLITQDRKPHPPVFLSCEDVGCSDDVGRHTHVCDAWVPATKQTTSHRVDHP